MNLPSLSRIYSTEEIADFVALQYEQCDIIFVSLRDRAQSGNLKYFRIVPALCFRILKTNDGTLDTIFLKSWREIDLLENDQKRPEPVGVPSIENLCRRFPGRRMISIGLSKPIAVALVRAQPDQSGDHWNRFKSVEFVNSLDIYLHRSAVYAGMSLEHSREELVDSINNCFSFSRHKTCDLLARSISRRYPGISCHCLSMQSKQWQEDSSYGAQDDFDVVDWIQSHMHQRNRTLIYNGKPVVSMFRGMHILALPFAHTLELFDHSNDVGRSDVAGGIFSIDRIFGNAFSDRPEMIDQVMRARRGKQPSLDRLYLLVFISKSNWPEYFLRNGVSQIESYFAYYRPKTWKKIFDSVTRSQPINLEDFVRGKNEHWLTRMLRTKSMALEALRNSLDALSITIRVAQNGYLDKIVDVSDSGVKFSNFGEHEHILQSSDNSINALTFRSDQSWRAIYIADVAEIADSMYLKVRSQTASELCIPLDINGVRYGVMNIEASSTHPFDRDTLDNVVNFTGELSKSIKSSLIASDQVHLEAGWHAIQGLHEVKSIAIAHKNDPGGEVSAQLFAVYENFLVNIEKPGPVAFSELLALLGRFKADYTSDDQLRLSIPDTLFSAEKRINGQDVRLFFIILANLVSNRRAYGDDADWINVFAREGESMLRIRVKVAKGLTQEVLRHNMMAPIFRSQKDRPARLPCLGLFIVGALARKMGGYAHFDLMGGRNGKRKPFRTIEVGVNLRSHVHED